MNNILRMTAFVLMLGILLVGCSRQDNGPVGSSTDQGLSLQGPDAITLPSGVTILSAKLVVNENGYEYATSSYDHNVQVHRITAPWLEDQVTWSNFANAYDPTVLGSFASLPAFTDPGQLWNQHEIDITPLVRGWVNGTISNYGVLLQQVEIDGHWTTYVSSENAQVALRPKLVITYSYGGSVMTGVVQRAISGEVADAYITENAGDYNGGASEVMYTGYIEQRMKLALLYFDITVSDGGCTRTIGYWKTHAGFGPQGDMVSPLLPIWLGTNGGASSIEVKTAQQAVGIFSQNVYGTPSNGITKLYAQLLAAKLNLKSGAGGGAIAVIVRLIDRYLASNSYTKWNSMSRIEKTLILVWHRTLDHYNNGLIGPRHCTDGPLPM